MWVAQCCTLWATLCYTCHQVLTGGIDLSMFRAKLPVFDLDKRKMNIVWIWIHDGFVRKKKVIQ